MIRELTETEKKPFHQWARKNYVPGDIRQLNVWHPEVVAECNRINREAEERGELWVCGWCGFSAADEKSGTDWEAYPYDWPRCSGCGAC